MSVIADGINQGLSFIIKNTAPRGKSLTIFNIIVPNGGTLDLMRIGGVSEDDVRASIVKGDVGRKLATGYLTMVSTTMNFESQDGNYTSFLTGLGISAATTASGNGSGQITNIAALASINDAAELNGASRFVNTVMESFVLDTSSTATVDGITVVATKSGVGRWIRDVSSSVHWRTQITWYLDPTNGADENTGLSSGNALASLQELARRMNGGLPRNTVTVNILNNITNTSDMFQINATVDPQGVFGAENPNATHGRFWPAIQFLGQRILATFTDPNTSSTTELTMTAAASAPAVVATTIASGSNGQALPQATINVASTTGMPTSGYVMVTTSAGSQVVNYTGTTGTSFTGCTGGTGTMSTSGQVTTQNPAMITVSGFNFAPYIGQNIQIDSSTPAASLKAIATICAAPATGIAWIQPLEVPPTNLGTTTAAPLTSANYPANGSTFHIYTPTQWSPKINPGVVNGQFAVAYTDIDFQPSTQEAPHGQQFFFQGCRFQRPISPGAGSEGGGIAVFNGCSFYFAAPTNFYSSTIASGSNGQALPQSTINVASTTGMPTSGSVLVTSDQGVQFISYTNITTTSFTGCTGGQGNLATGNTVFLQRTPTQWVMTNGDWRFNDCAFINTDLRLREQTGKAFNLDSLFVGGSYIVGGPNDAGRVGGSGAGPGGGVSTYGTGFFGWASQNAVAPSPATTRGSYGAAYHIGHGGQSVLGRRIYGANPNGGTYGLICMEHGSVLVPDTATSGSPSNLGGENPNYAPLTLALHGAAGGVLLDNDGYHYNYQSSTLTPDRQTGQVILSSGTATVSTGIALTSGSEIFFNVATASGTLGSHYAVISTTTGAVGAASFTVNAISTAGSLVNTDNSTLNYTIFSPQLYTRLQSWADWENVFNRNVVSKKTGATIYSVLT